MKGLLARKGVKVVTEEEEEGSGRTYAFTERMLGIKVFIRFYEFDYGAGEVPQYESEVSVLFHDYSCSYNFSIFYDQQPFVSPLVLYRIIVDLAEIIDSSTQETLIENLRGAARDVTISDEFDDLKTRRFIYEGMVIEVGNVLRLIEADS